MRIELRVCYHCLRGEHENEHKTAVTRDLVACAEVVKEYKDVIDLDDVHIRKVKEEEGDDGRPAALPAVAATIQNEGVAVSDTQLVTMGENGYMLVYPNPQDALKVLAGNIDEISKVIGDNILPDLSPEGAEILSGAPLGGGPEAEHGGGPGAEHGGGPGAGPGAGGPTQGQPDADGSMDGGPGTQ